MAAKRTCAPPTAKVGNACSISGGEASSCGLCGWRFHLDLPQGLAPTRTGMIRLCHSAITFAAAIVCALAAASPAGARVLNVGADRALKTPSEAATVAAAGDIVRIDPGTYVDCAFWRASRLLIEAAGPGVRIEGKVCGEKAIFVIQGDDITIRGITFAGATVVWHNAAGIRVEGAEPDGRSQPVPEQRERHPGRRRGRTACCGSSAANSSATAVASLPAHTASMRARRSTCWTSSIVSSSTPKPRTTSSRGRAIRWCATAASRMDRPERPAT